MLKKKKRYYELNWHTDKINIWTYLLQCLNLRPTLQILSYSKELTLKITFYSILEEKTKMSFFIRLTLIYTQKTTHIKKSNDYKGFQIICPFFFLLYIFILKQNSLLKSFC